MRDNQEAKAMAAALASGVIFGFSLLFSTLALEVATPFILLSMRFLTAFLLMTALWALGAVKLNLRGKRWGKLLGLGLLQPVLYFIGENYGIRYATSSFAGIMIALIPVVAMFLGAPILKEKPTRLQALFACCSLLGVVLVSLKGGEDGSVTVPGFLLLCLAVFSAAGFNLLSRNTAAEFSAFERTYVMFALGSVFFLVMAFVENGPAFPAKALEAFGHPQFLAAVVYLAGFSSVAAFLCHNYAITYLSVTRTAAFSNITTVVAVIAGITLLREPSSPVQLVAMALIIIGVYGVNRSGEKPVPAAEVQ